MTKLLNICWNDVLFLLFRGSYFQQMLNNFVNFNFFYPPNFQGLILVKNPLISQVAMLGDIFSWLVAKAIYLVKQACEMMNWHLRWYVVQNSFFRFSPKENVCTYLVRAELFYIAHYQHVPVPVEGFKNWGARNNFTSFERICFAFIPGKIWGCTCTPETSGI